MIQKITFLILLVAFTLSLLVSGQSRVNSQNQPTPKQDENSKEKKLSSAEEREALRQAQRPREVDRVVDKSLEYILGQQRSDGSFGASAHYRTALTSLSLMALLSRGHVPGPTKYGKAVSKGLDYLLSEKRQDSSGYFGNDNPGGSTKSGMYGHGITTLLLAELLGMGVSKEQEAKIVKALKNSIKLILKSQASRKSKGHEGGWRYSPESFVSDLSITVWQVMALRAAKNAGMDVPDKAIELAIGFIKNCFHQKQGGFIYQPGRTPIPSTVAAGILALQVCGIYNSIEVRRSADWLGQRPPQWTDQWIYYSIYYYAMAMHQLGETTDKVAQKKVRELILNRQQKDGSFPEPPNSGLEARAGPIYRTTLVVLSLSVEYRYLPIYQR